MNRMQIAAAASLLCSRCALAQPVFFDDFDGNELKPWWGKISECGDWEYNVSDSMLNVTKIKKIKNCNNTQVRIVTSPGSYGDFEATALIGWDDGEWQNLGFTITRFSGVLLAGFGYNKFPGEAALVTAALSDGISSERIDVPAPPPGMHEWRLSRHGDVLSAFLNGQLLLQVVEDIHFDALGVELSFNGAPDSPLFAPLHADSVHIVPAPSVLYAAAVSGLILGHRRRRNQGEPR